MWAETGARGRWYGPFLLPVAAAQPGSLLLHEGFPSPLGGELPVLSWAPALCVDLICTLPEGRNGGVCGGPQVSLLPWEGQCWSPAARPLHPRKQRTGPDTSCFPPASGEKV